MFTLASGYAFVLLLTVIIWAATGGVDFGAGIVDLMAKGDRAHKQRRLIANKFGPVWEANHTWLIVAVVLTFVGLPTTFYLLMYANFIPLILLAFAILFRGAAYVYRWYDTDDTFQSTWGKVFGWSSLAAPFLLGLSIAGMVTRYVTVDDGEITSGLMAGWASPFSFFFAGFITALVAFIAATTLAHQSREDEKMAVDFIGYAMKLAKVVGVLLVVTLVLSPGGAPRFWESVLTNWYWVILALASGGLSVSAMRQGEVLWARLGALGFAAFLLLVWGFALWPEILPGVDASVGMAPTVVLKVILTALAVGAIPLVIGFFYLYKLAETNPLSDED